MARAPTTNLPLAGALTPLDVRLAARTAATTLLLASAALLVLSQTDEPTSTWADRAARLGAMAPALAGLAAALHAAQLRRRGEALALQLAGASPLRQALGAALGGAAVGAGAALASALLSPSLRALLPVAASSPWRPERGGFEAATLGVWLPVAGGSIHFQDALAVAPAAPPRLAIGGALALASLLTPWWAALPAPGAARALVGGLAVLGAIVSLHAIAQGHSAALLLLPSLLLLGHLLWLGRAQAQVSSKGSR